MKRRGALAIVLGSALAGLSASAQRIDPRRPQTLFVGAVEGPSPTDRVDGRRSGFSRAPLPSGTLRVAWRRAFSQTIDYAPLALAGGDVALLVGRGELVEIGDDGAEKWRLALGGAPIAAPTLLSGGTIVVVTSGGEAVGVAEGTIRFRARVGGERSGVARVSPLSLEDGGVVVATATELTALDSTGGVRARAIVPEPLATPLLAALGQVIAIAASGVVYGWTPGREPLRLGTFGAAIDGGAALAGGTTLVAVIGGSRVAALDLRRGVAVTRAVAPSGLYLGPPSIRGETAIVLSQTPGATYVVSVDASGQEVSRTRVATTTPALLVDGGFAPLAVTTHTGTIVDAAGTIAFATPDGHVGVVAGGAIELLGEPLCARSSGSSRPGGAVVGIAPAARRSGESGALIALCDGGVIAKIVSE